MREETAVNEKFWDLKKSRQDSMINGGLRVFAENGFRHASTDEIVAEASVSKGLLFHYFYSKTGLYSFLAEYAARFALVELRSELRKRETLPYVEFERALTAAEASAMRKYPYLTLLIKTVETDGASGEAEKESLELYTGCLKELTGNCILPETMTREDAVRISGLLSLYRTDTAESLLRSGNFTPERYAAAVAESISFFEKFY